MYQSVSEGLDSVLSSPLRSFFAASALVGFAAIAAFSLPSALEENAPQQQPDIYASYNP